MIPLDLPAAIQQWSTLLGDEGIIVSSEALHCVEQATFATQQRVPAILLPRNTEQVCECVRIANRFSMPLYPISRGRNWGLGSMVPVESGCCVLDLRHLDLIIEFDDELGTLTLEPGVTLRQVTAFLADRGATHFLSVIGGPPDASVIGNFVERGTGLGPMGDRVSHACAAEVVLGTGEIIRTGFAQFPNSKLAHLHAWGVGPSIDGLFSQSNFGIITKLTVWLTKTPNFFQSVFFTLDRDEHLEPVVTRLRELQKQHVLQPHCLALWNDFKFAATLRQHPDPKSGRLDVAQLLAEISPRMKCDKWFGLGGLFAESRAGGLAQRTAIQQAIGGLCRSLRFIDPFRYRILKSLSHIARRLRLSSPINEVLLENLYAKSVFLGHPTETSLASIYWRKPMPVPEGIDPHRDECGIHWLCHAVPYMASDIRIAVSCATDVILDAGLEPNLSVISVSDRHVRLLIALFYDRAVSGEDDRAQHCHDRVVQTLNELGYTSFRLGIQSMNQMPARNEANTRLHEQLKRLFDPNGVIAPGRYS